MFAFSLMLVFVTLTILFYSVILFLFYRKLAIQERLETNVLAQSSVESMNQESKPHIPFQVTVINTLDRLLYHKKYFVKIKKKLAQANILMKPEEFIGISALSGLFTALLLFFIFHKIVLLLLGLLLGFVIPSMFLKQIKKKRAKKLNEQLPEALGMISNGIRAGYSFTQAIAAVSKELQAPIAEEFQKVIRDNSMGKPVEEALLAVSERTEDEDLDMFITALIIQRQVGGNLSEILDTISNTIRERVRVKGEIRTITSQSRFSSVVIGILPIALAGLIMVLNRNYMSVLFKNQIGIIILGIALIMEIIGILLLKKIVDINY